MEKETPKHEILLMKPFMPPLEELQPYLERIWKSRWITNNGPIQRELEQALCEYLKVKHISLVANGTLALMLALKVLETEGEVITTAFTFPATAQAVYWNNLKPVFIDINESDLNLNPENIENAITDQTKVILPVHTFGNPCAVDQIQNIAQNHNLKVIYDAAHCFGVEMNERPIIDFGDLSILSFHATKVFNSIEGGAVICKNAEQKQHIDALANNGIKPNKQLAGYGINAKMNELQCAMALVQLKYVDKVIGLRKLAVAKYKTQLENIRGLRIISPDESIKQNYTYLPIIVNPLEFGASRDDLLKQLESRNVFAKPYFYPLISDFEEFKNYWNDGLQVARIMANNVLCLPLFHDISDEEIVRIVDTIVQFQLKGSSV